MLKSKIFGLLGILVMGIAAQAEIRKFEVVADTSGNCSPGFLCMFAVNVEPAKLLIFDHKTLSYTVPVDDPDVGSIRMYFERQDCGDKKSPIRNSNLIFVDEEFGVWSFSEEALKSCSAIPMI